MEVIKSFISHLLAFVLFIAVLFLGIVMFSKEILTHEVIYNSLEKSEILNEAMQNNEYLTKVDIPKELLDYVEINDIIYNYITDDFLYEANIIETKPSINRMELNDRLALGVEKYIDDKLDEYTGGLNSLLIDAGIDLGLKEKVEDYIENKTSIDLTNNEIVSSDDLESIYSYVDETILDIRNSSYVFEMIDFVNNEQYQLWALIISLVCLVLIGLINLSFVSLFAYSIAPFIANAVIYLGCYLVTKNVDFEGRLTAQVINTMEDIVSSVCLKYFILFALASLVIVLIYYILKNIRIVLSHKKGIATLDTVFDDYNIDEVVKEINSKEENDLTSGEVEQSVNDSKETNDNEENVVEDKETINNNKGKNDDEENTLNFENLKKDENVNKKKKKEIDKNSKKKKKSSKEKKKTIDKTEGKD